MLANKTLLFAYFSAYCSLAAMSNTIVNKTCKRLLQDNVVRAFLAAVTAFSFFTASYISFWFGLFALSTFAAGCVVPLLLLKNKDFVGQLFDQVKDACGYSNSSEVTIAKCDTCDDLECQRHKAQEIPREPWKGLSVECDLDEAVASFYSRILNSFVKSWFSVVSQDEDFIHTLKLGLREATCHLIKRMKTLNAAAIITNRLLPIAFEHIEAVKEMLKNDMPMDKLPNGFLQNNRPIHPAVVNRQAELDYLRAVSKCLISRVFRNEKFDSKIFFSLVRELLACWVLLPLMDVISDPNLINLMIVTATNKGSTLKYSKVPGDRVEFLKNFVSVHDDARIESDDSYLADRNQLFYFIKFMEKEGAVDVLRFYLDVDNLNRELQDSRVTTDPAKLSTLHRQSIKLLQDYHNLNTNSDSPTAKTLAEAHERVRVCLDGKWRKAFHKTPQYFKLIYFSKDIKSNDDFKSADSSGPVSRLSSKLKDVIKGAIDGAPMEATEVPTVWDALSEPQIATVNPNIYYSVAQKLRKERGQNLDAFLADFMQSIEQSMDVGEDVADMSSLRGAHRPQPPGRNLVFGNLFGLAKNTRNVAANNYASSIAGVKGPSECFMYILYKLLRVPTILVRFIFAFVCISKRTMDALISHIITKLILLGLYEPRLAVLIRLLENHLFGPKTPDASYEELLQRQKLARERLEDLLGGTGELLDTLQSPALNKHLMYCLVDVVLGELYPEFESVDVS